MKNSSALIRLAWATVAWNVLVILWGAVVRATGSGAGCGSHWPLCDGEVLPQDPGLDKVIEFSHRLTSGVALILVVAVFWLVWKRFPSGHRVRWAATASLILILLEAAIGAGIVLLELVGENGSVSRAAYMAGHLANTLLLLAALTLTARWIQAPEREPPSSPAPVLRRFASGLTAWALAGLLLTGISGAISALGDTLFPAASLAHGLQQDLSPVHFLLRLRLFHPLIAVATAIALLILARRELERLERTPRSIRLAQALMAAVLVQVGAGVLNIALLAPVWMQIVHLLLADIVWITFILFVDGRADPALNPACEPLRMGL
jgi:heme A synthase